MVYKEASKITSLALAAKWVKSRERGKGHCARVVRCRSARPAALRSEKLARREKAGRSARVLSSCRSDRPASLRSEEDARGEEDGRSARVVSSWAALRSEEVARQEEESTVRGFPFRADFLGLAALRSSLSTNHRFDFPPNLRSKVCLPEIYVPPA